MHFADSFYTIDAYIKVTQSLLSNTPEKATQSQPHEIIISQQPFVLRKEYWKVELPHTQ